MGEEIYSPKTTPAVERTQPHSVGICAFLRVKWPERDVDHFPCSAGVKNERSCIPRVYHHGLGRKFRPGNVRIKLAMLLRRCVHLGHVYNMEVVAEGHLDIGSVTHSQKYGIVRVQLKPDGKR